MYEQGQAASGRNPAMNMKQMQDRPPGGDFAGTMEGLGQVVNSIESELMDVIKKIMPITCGRVEFIEAHDVPVEQRGISTRAQSELVQMIQAYSTRLSRVAQKLNEIHNRIDL